MRCSLAACVPESSPFALVRKRATEGGAARPGAGPRHRRVRPRAKGPYQARHASLSGGCVGDGMGSPCNTGMAQVYIEMPGAGAFSSVGRYAGREQADIRRDAVQCANDGGIAKRVHSANPALRPTNTTDSSTYSHTMLRLFQTGRRDSERRRIQSSTNLYCASSLAQMKPADFPKP